MQESKEVSQHQSESLNKDLNSKVSKQVYWMEFSVDLLGGLVPGIIFVVCSIFAIVPSLIVLISSLSSASNVIWDTYQAQSPIYVTFEDFFAKINGTPNVLWIGAFVIFLIFSYVLGHLFYRRDPKKPTIASFKLLLRKSPNQKTSFLKSNFACTRLEECQFPFPYLTKYLEHRGHHHLVPLVKWKDNTLRSKTHINAMKLRLRFHWPEAFRVIIRNEAHVRLATSAWYMARAVIWISSGCFVIIVTSWILAILLGGNSVDEKTELIELVRANLKWLLVPLLFPILTVFLAYFVKIFTEKFMYYQRLREVFFVLELAYVAFRKEPSLLTYDQSVYDLLNES